MCNPLIEGLRIEDTAQPFVANPDFFCHALIDTHWAGASRRPERAAVINFKGRFTNEVEHIVGALNRLGVATSAIDAAKLRCTPDGVGDESGERLDLVYGKFDPRDLLGEPMVADFLMAAAGGQTTCVNPLVSQFVLADKIVLAVLSDEQFSSNFSSAERALVRMHVPWTRIVRRGVTSDPEGRRADLLDYITANKDRLVLKPSNATRGEGAVVGSFTDRKTWERHLARAASSTPYVVQEYLRGTTITATNPASETFDTMTAGLDVYVFNGWFAGFHARASLDPVINIGKRGMLLPVAVIAEGRLS
jgi:diaminobutyrate-2-oxoglutarate transaminase